MTDDMICINDRIICLESQGIYFAYLQSYHQPATSGWCRIHRALKEAAKDAVMWMEDPQRGETIEEVLIDAIKRELRIAAPYTQYQVTPTEGDGLHAYSITLQGTIVAAACITLQSIEPTGVTNGNRSEGDDSVGNSTVLSRKSKRRGEVGADYQGKAYDDEGQGTVPSPTVRGENNALFG